MTRQVGESLLEEMFSVLAAGWSARASAYDILSGVIFTVSAF